MNSKKIASIVFFTLAGIFLSVGFVWWTVAPYYQMMLWRSDMNAFRKGDDSRFPNDPVIFSHDTPAQGRMRLDSFSALFNQYVNGERTGYTPLYDTALTRVEEWVNNHPVQYSFLLFLAKAYEYKGNLTQNYGNYGTADEYYKKAIALSPERQDLLYAYAEHLSNTGKKDDAVALLQKMREKDPGIIQTQYYLGVVLAANEKKDYNDAIRYIEGAFDQSQGRVPFDPVVIKTLYEHFLVYYYEKNDFEHFRLAAYRLYNIDTEQRDAYTVITKFLEEHHQIPLLNIHE